MKQLSSAKGFTLIEVLVGVIIISIISIASFTTVSVLTRSTEASRNQIIASNLIQKSMEEVRRVAQTEFDDLNTCAFPAGGALTGDACGFEVTDTHFPGFSRTLTVTNEELHSAELKRVVVSASWMDMGSPRNLTSVMLISRPPEPLPGNIWGRVYEEGDPTALIKDAKVKVTKVDGTENQEVQSRATLDSDGHNYDFSESVSGQYILDAGSWNMRVTHDQYDTYDYPVPIVVEEGGPPALIDISMTPRPEPEEPATVSYRIVDRNTGALVNYSADQYGPHVYLREGSGGGYRYDSNREDDPEHTFTVNFGRQDDPNYRDPICMTMFTWRPYLAMWTYPTGFGGAPSCSYEYNKNGWSSAYVRDDMGSLMCGYPHWDSSNAGGDIDRICVSPGETEHVTIPMEPIPTVTVTGKITGHAPGTTPQLYVRWPDNVYDKWDRWMRNNHIKYAIDADASGNFSVELPAVQAFHGMGNPARDFMRIRPRGYVPYMACCDNDTTSRQWGSYYNVGPLFPGGSTIDVGTLPLPGVGDNNCGNVNGNIIDAKTGGAINGATVRIRSTNDGTDGTGYYEHVCSGPGYRLYAPGGRQTVEVSHGSYYNLSTGGNDYYTSKWGVNILTDQTVTWDGKLWPVGYAQQLIVTVLDASTDVPIEDADVRLHLHTGSTSTATTNSAGQATFYNVRETWPPPALNPADTYFEHTPRGHSVEVYNIDGGNYIVPESENVDSLNDGEIKNVTIKVAPKGAA